MSGRTPVCTNDPGNAALLRQRALSRWDNEGGAGPAGPPTEPDQHDGPIPMPTNAAAEVTPLHIRVIALENLVAVLLATASDRQIQQAHEMARVISPRPGARRHLLTTHAAAHMTSLIERAVRFGNALTPA